MAFIRRVRTASGATTVQIAEYADGRQRIVKHLGSAHTEAELGVLLQRARVLLEDPGQGVRELGVEPAPRVAGLVPPAGEAVLFEAGHGSPVGSGRDGPGRVVGTDARVLFDALAAVYPGLGFDALGDEVVRDLVIAGVVEPTSLLDAGRVLRGLGREPAGYATMKRGLGRAAEGRYRDQIAAWCFRRASTSGDVSLVLYDVTTLYFEAEKEDDLRKVGYSKERRVDPQIVVGLLNIPLNVMPPAEGIGSYHDLWHVEQSFRMSKSELQARPVFHRTRDAIEAHLTIVFTALAVSRMVQARTGLALRNVIKQLRSLRSAAIAINGARQAFPPAIPAEKQAILDDLHRAEVTR